MFGAGEERMEVWVELENQSRAPCRTEFALCMPEHAAGRDSSSYSTVTSFRVIFIL